MGEIRSIKCTILTILCIWFSSVKYIHIVVQQNFFILQNWNYTHWTLIFPLFPSPWQPPFYFLFLWFWLFKILHMSIIIQHSLFYNWLISRSIMFSSFIHVVDMAGFPSFLMLNNFLLYVYTTFLLSIHPSMNVLF